MNFLRSLLFTLVMFYVDPPSLASQPPVGDGEPPVDKGAAPDAAAAAAAPAAGPKPEELTAATEFLAKNMDGFTPEVAKGKKPEEIMALRGAYDTVQSNDARKYLKGSGVKAEDVAKMSNADAIKAADEARSKPVEYKDFTLPEGMVKDEVLDKSFRAWASKNRLSQEAAQEIVTGYSNRLNELVNAPYQQWKDTQKTWREEVAKDPEIGGAKLQENLGQIGKMVDKVMGANAKSVREAMDFTGFGNNPAGIRFMFALSKYFAEGGPIPGKGPVTGDKKNPANVLYPDHPSEVTG